MPTLLPLCRPSHCMPEVPAWYTSVPSMKKVSLGAINTPSHHPPFHTVQLSGKSRIYVGYSQSQPTSSPCSSCHQDPPNSLALSQLVTSTPAWVYCWLCVTCCLVFPPLTLCVHVSSGTGLGLPHPGRGGNCWAAIADCSPLMSPRQPQSLAPGPGTFPIGL